MSFIISMRVSEGIVMAADSCLGNDKTVLSKSFNKLFLTHNIGISYGGDSHYKYIAITHHISNFLEQIELSPPPHTPLQVAKALNDYVRGLSPDLDCRFHVCGYEAADDPIPRIYVVQTKENSVEAFNNPDTCSCVCSSIGEWCYNIPLMCMSSNGPNYSMQDAVDLCVFSIQTAENILRFQGQPVVIGGPIDVLAIYPHHAEYISHKKLSIGT